MRLGCLDHDPTRAALLPAARYGIAPPPPSLPTATWQPQMWANDTLGDCVIAALGNAARAWSNKLTGDDTEIGTTDVVALFARVAGLPSDATEAQLEAVDGLDPMLAVETAQVSGWALAGRQVPLVPDFATVASSRSALAEGMARTGSVMLAVTLYEADMDAFEAGRPWVDAPSGDVAGGHMIAAVSYDGTRDSSMTQIATWGQWQSTSWQWLAARLRLALATGWRQLCAPGADYPALWSAEVVA